MTDRLAIALAQLNPTVGYLSGNIDRVRTARAEAAARGADLMVCSELVVSGCPPEDLVLKPFFPAAVERAVEELARETADGGPAVLIGAPWRNGDGVHNAVLLLDGGKVAAVRYKHDLANDGCFDEKRVFAAGPVPGPINFRGVRLGVLIGDDMATADVAETLAECGAELLIVPAASPFATEHGDVRMNAAVARVTETELPLVYVNQVGGQDERVFDGTSFVLDHDRTLKAQAPGFREHLLVTRWERDDENRWVCQEGEILPPAEGPEAIYQALMLGLRDHVNKNRFPGVLIGLSGGIDSALAAAVAVDALGADRVHAVTMPSAQTPRVSVEDAAEVAQLLGCKPYEIDIQPAVQIIDKMLAPAFLGRDRDDTEDSIESRVRGLTLMALSDKFGGMVLSAVNKSDLSVGHATLYGDMSGCYALLKDVYRTTVFELARWRNGALPQGALGPAGRVLPERMTAKAVELKPGRDMLPPSEVLDDILECLIERDIGIDDIVARGHDRETVDRVWRMLERAEYKRRQAPPGVRMTGREQRNPITNGFASVVET
jgi:NAD+ synthase